MSKTVTSRYDVAEHLRTPAEMVAYFEACLEEADGDASLIAKALGDIARAQGMTQVARDAGLSRESLYKALSGERSPDFETVLKVVGALGLELHAKVARKGLKRPASARRKRDPKQLNAATAGVGARGAAGAVQPGATSGVAPAKASRGRRSRVSAR